MVVGTIFQANLNADKIYIDMTYLPATVKHKFWLTIQNQSLMTLYFKIVNNISNWSLNTPADGKLGSVAAGGTSTKTQILSRAKPGAETTDSGNLTIEAYTDSGYTNKVSEDTLDVTVYFEDLENWTDVTKSDFDDGTAQGWTLTPTYMSIANDESVEVGGYSAKFYRPFEYDMETYLSKSIALPNRNKVRVSFFIAVLIYNVGSAHDLSILVDGTKVFDVPFIWYTGSVYPGVALGWLKVTADLSAYKGQTVTLKLRTYVKVENGTNEVGLVWVDRIVIAGKD